MAAGLGGWVTIPLARCCRDVCVGSWRWGRSSVCPIQRPPELAPLAPLPRGVVGRRGQGGDALSASRAVGVGCAEQAGVGHSCPRSRVQRLAAGRHRLCAAAFVRGATEMINAAIIATHPPLPSAHCAPGSPPRVEAPASSATDGGPRVCPLALLVVWGSCHCQCWLWAATGERGTVLIWHNMASAPQSPFWSAKVPEGRSAATH